MHRVRYHSSDCTCSGTIIISLHVHELIFTWQSFEHLFQKIILGDIIQPTMKYQIYLLLKSNWVSRDWTLSMILVKIWLQHSASFFMSIIHFSFLKQQPLISVIWPLSFTLMHYILKSHSYLICVYTFKSQSIVLF